MLGKYSINKPFVDVFEIARHEGFAIIYFYPQDARQRSISGLSKDRKIYLNSADSPQEQAFAIARELAHHFLGHAPDQIGVYYRNSLYNEDRPDIEKKADFFAAELLIPERFIEDVRRIYGLDAERDQAVLAKLFGVSEFVMAYRLRGLRRDARI